LKSAQIGSYSINFGLSSAFDAYPDPAYHFDVDLDPVYTGTFDADPDPAYTFDADPDPTFQSGFTTLLRT
jgi:hypothetical protein